MNGGVQVAWTSEDRRFMARALSLARRSVGRCSPNPPVGCVLVSQGSICGEGFHIYDELDHAEVKALRSAGSQARGATAYISLEPCSHLGRTPPCADQLIQAGIRRVVVPCVDPNPLVSGKGIERLRAAGVQVDSGLLADAALRWIEPFACHIRYGRPLVVAKVGMTLDGRIAAPNPVDNFITSKAGKAFGQTLRLELDAILTGSGTVLVDDPKLTYRGRRKKDKPLMRVILDGSLRTSPEAALFIDVSRSPVLIFTRGEVSEERRAALQARGAEICIAPRGRSCGVDLNHVLEELARRKILGLLVEGGSEVHWSFLAEGLVDKFYFLVSPLVLGGKGAVPAVSGEGCPRISDAIRFIIRRSFRCGPDLAIEAYPKNSRSILSPWRP